MSIRCVQIFKSGEKFKSLSHVDCLLSLFHAYIRVPKICHIIKDLLLGIMIQRRCQPVTGSKIHSNFHPARIIGDLPNQ